MDRYVIKERLGDGTFGTVWKAVHTESGDVVAVKRLKRRFREWGECLALREVDALRRVRHPGIVRLREVVRQQEQLHLVFEFVGPNLYELTRDRARHLPEATVRSWLRQLLQALAHLHGEGYFHRDIKPENLLVRGETVIKVADLGLVRDVDSAPPYTEYVSTRWYRAPELILRAPAYGPPVDIFACGAVAAELYSLAPLFPGSSEADQLARICAVLGSPTEVTWAGGLRLAEAAGFGFVPAPPASLAALLPTASPAAVDLIRQLCAWDPAKRPTAAQALQHPFFQAGARSRPLASTAALRQRLAAAAGRLAAAAAARAAAREEGPAPEARPPAVKRAAACAPRRGAAPEAGPPQLAGGAQGGERAGPLRRLARQAAGRRRSQLREHRAAQVVEAQQEATPSAAGAPRGGHGSKLMLCQRQRSHDDDGSPKITTEVAAPNPARP